MHQAQEAGHGVQYLSFHIGGEEYAVPILRAREIVECGAITRGPTVPACIRGVVNIRGSVVPVVDLAVKFGLPESTMSKGSCIVIVEIEIDEAPAVMGLLVDAIGQVIDLSADDTAEPPPFGTRVRVDYLLGMGRAGSKFVLLLDIDLVLSKGELLAATSLPPPEGAEAEDLVAGEGAGGAPEPPPSKEMAAP